MTVLSQLHQSLKKLTENVSTKFITDYLFIYVCYGFMVRRKPSYFQYHY